MEAPSLPRLFDGGSPSSVSSTDPGGEESKMNIYLKVIRTVTLEVEKTEKIENLKALLCEKEGNSEYALDVFFAGNHLKNGKSLVDYGVQKDSTLHAFQRPLLGQKISIKTPLNQKTIEIEARDYDTLQNIKSEIQIKEGIKPDRYTLVCNGNILEDDCTVASITTGSQSTFQMVFNLNDSLSFSVKTSSGEVVQLKMKASFTAGDVKEIVSGMGFQPVTGHSLTYSGAQLDNHKILACYNIAEGSILEMLPSWTQIFVKTWRGETITLNYRQSETVDDILGNVLKKLKIANQQNFVKYASLVYAGKRLTGDQDLASYNIQKHSTLQMVLSPSSRGIEMDVAEAAGSEIPTSTRILSLKAMIKERMGGPVEQLLFEGKPLSNDRTMEDYGMTNSSKVIIFFSMACGAV